MTSHPIELHRGAVAIGGRPVVRGVDLVVPTGEERATGRGWTALYRAGPANALRPPMLRPEIDA